MIPVRKVSQQQRWSEKRRVCSSFSYICPPREKAIYNIREEGSYVTLLWLLSEQVRSLPPSLVFRRHHSSGLQKTNLFSCSLLFRFVLWQKRRHVPFEPSVRPIWSLRLLCSNIINGAYRAFLASVPWMACFFFSFFGTVSYAGDCHRNEGSPIGPAFCLWQTG